MNETILKEILQSHSDYLKGNGGAKANLSGANLSRANLSGANLSGADLSRADLFGTIGIYSFGGIGGKRRIGVAVKHDKTVMFTLGCFWGNKNEAIYAVRQKYGAKSLYEEQIKLASKILTKG